jgi:phosphoserine phosphatase RsbU/P
LFYKCYTKGDRVYENCSALPVCSIDAETNIYEYEINGWQKGSILVIKSDGLKESRNATGEMYGEKRILKVIENNKIQAAAIIEKKIFEDLNDFCQNVPIANGIAIVKFL